MTVSSSASSRTLRGLFNSGEGGESASEPTSVMGGATDVVENQACALEPLVDSLLLEASEAFEKGAELEVPSNSIVNHNLLYQKQRRM